MNQKVTKSLNDSSFWNFNYDILGQFKSGKRKFAENVFVAGEQFEYQYGLIGNRLSFLFSSSTNMKTLLSVLFCALIMACKPSKPPGISPENYVADKFPTGTSLSTVVDELTNAKIEFSYNEKENKIYGIFRNTGASGRVVKESTTFLVWFNQSNQVTKTETKTVLTGP